MSPRQYNRVVISHTNLQERLREELTHQPTQSALARHIGVPTTNLATVLNEISKTIKRPVFDQISERIGGVTSAPEAFQKPCFAKRGALVIIQKTNLAERILAFQKKHDLTYIALAQRLDVTAQILRSVVKYTTRTCSQDVYDSIVAAIDGVVSDDDAFISVSDTQNGPLHAVGRPRTEDTPTKFIVIAKTKLCQALEKQLSAGVTQVEIAKTVGVSAPMISMIVTGRVDRITFLTGEALCRHLGIDVPNNAVEFSTTQTDTKKWLRDQIKDLQRQLDQKANSVKLDDDNMAELRRLSKDVRLGGHQIIVQNALTLYAASLSSRTWPQTVKLLERGRTRSVMVVSKVEKTSL